MRRSTAILALTALASLTPVAHSAPAARADVIFTAQCSSQLLSGSGVALSTKVKLESVGDLPALVTFVPGWNIGRFYPKAEKKRIVRLEAGETATFTVTRRLPRAPALRAALQRPARLRCASSIAVKALRD